MAAGPGGWGETFGAAVDVARPDTGLCLVVGREAAPTAAVHRHGARVVTQVLDRRLLALASFDALQALQGDPEVALAGPVAIDPARFARFCAVAGIDPPAPERSP